MIEKLLRPISRMGKMKLKGLPKAFILIVVGLLIMSILMYLSGCLFIWYMDNRPPLKDINIIITTLTSVPAIAAIGFLGKAMVDDDGNGTPNVWEEKGAINEKNYIESTERDDGRVEGQTVPDGKDSR